METEGLSKYAAAVRLLLHSISCVFCLLIGHRFSRHSYFLLPPPPPYYSISSPNLQPSPLPQPPKPPPLPQPPNQSHVAVGRHGILIRAWPHPLPEQTARAQRILARVQQEQRAAYGVKNPRRILAITPTYVRTFQTLHLASVMHSLMLQPYDLTWIVVEAGGKTAETAAILARSNLSTIHLDFDGTMPVKWTERSRVEARMRLLALSMIREKKMEGIVVFVDDSNVYSMEFFDEIQSVKWMGTLSFGILPHSGVGETLKDADLPIQGPVCGPSGYLIGWHSFEALNQASYVGESGFVLPMDLEWAGFVMNASILWKDAEDRPEWIIDLDLIEDIDGAERKNPLMFVKDPSFIEPLGDCGKKVMLWWVRVEARADSRFPPGWTLEEPLEIIVPWRRTPWPEKSWVGPSVSTPRSTRKRRSSRKRRRREDRYSGGSN